MSASDDTPGPLPLTDKDTAADALERIAGSAALRPNQSELFRWFVKNYAEFAAIADGAIRPAWASVSQELHRLGITKADGEPLAAERVRRTWAKVRAQQAKGARLDAPQAAPPDPPTTRKPNKLPAKQPAIASPMPEPEPQPDEPEEPFLLTFGSGATQSATIKGPK